MDGMANKKGASQRHRSVVGERGALPMGKGAHRKNASTRNGSQVLLRRYGNLRRRRDARGL